LSSATAAKAAAAATAATAPSQMQNLFTLSDLDFETPFAAAGASYQT
jgi:hypothetical protein